MEFLIRRMAGRGHEEATPVVGGDEGGICRSLCRDWRKVYPLRHSHGTEIRRELLRCPDAGADARAAFGMDDGAGAATWLYRDFYVHVAPPRPSIDRAIGRLRRGDPSEVGEMLAAPEVSDQGLRRMWYEVSTLAGLLAGMPRMEPGAGIASASESADEDFDLGLLPRGDGAGVANRAEVSARMLEALNGPLSIEAHRQRMLRSLHMLLGGDMARGDAAACMGLLLHHTDLILRQPLRLDGLGRHQAAGLYRALIALQSWLRDPVRFGKLLRAGLCSPSRQRRFLSYRLLRLEGQVEDDLHPDDAVAST